MRQYWTIKAEHMDLVLFVKIGAGGKKGGASLSEVTFVCVCACTLAGKFYEAFDLDAALLNRCVALPLYARHCVSLA